MAILVKNNSKRLVKEIYDLKHHNKPLLKLLFDCRNFCNAEFNKDITITMIYRTDSEQDSIYDGKTNKKGILYNDKPWKSPHQFYHALDLRSKTFSTEEIDKLVSYLNEKYDESNYYKFTALNHSIGLGDHFHVQYYKKG